MKPPVKCQGPVGITRRNMLQAGAISALGLTLPQVLAAGDRLAGKRQAASADSCILVFLNGGPSHLDTWDMKPDAPKELRSEFSSIDTTLPGLRVCEHLPKLAQVAKHCTLVRSVNHDQVAHAPAVYTALTGIKSNIRAGIMGAKPTDYPAIGAVVGQMRPTKSMLLPYVLLPYLTAEGAGGPPQPGFLGGMLGQTHDPLIVQQSGKTPDGLAMPALAFGPDMSPARVQERMQLLGGLNNGLNRPGQAQEMNALQARARDLLTSAAAQRAFELDQESPRLRDAYGRNIYGQSMLLARRLVEAGTRLTCVSWAPDANATWDTHGANFAKLKKDLLPPFDTAFSTLLTDLVERGMLERTLVVVMGEIGRTPAINANAGRDHWGFCYTALLAGGGVKPGVLYGSSDQRGAHPRSNPVSATDLVATIYHALGIPADLEIHDRLSRPMPLLPDGAPVRELFA